MIGAIATSMRSKKLVPPPAPGVLATFDAARAASTYTLSGGNTVAAHNSASDDVIWMEYQRSSGKYWLEFLFGSGTNVEFQGFGIGTSAAGSAAGSSIGIGTTSKQIYEKATRGTWYSYYNSTDTSIITGGPSAAPGNVLVAYVDCDNRKFFLGIQAGGSGAVSWITDDPKVTPSGGEPWQVTGNCGPGLSCYYNGPSVTLRAPGSFSATGSMPTGATQGWDNA